jgi:hypothetical protein
VTGEVREHRIETVHGLYPSLLLWVDDHALASGTARSSRETDRRRAQLVTTTAPRSGTWVRPARLRCRKARCRSSRTTGPLVRRAAG